MSDQWELTDNRVERVLGELRAKRDMRLDRAIVALGYIRGNLLFRRLTGGGWWFGPERHPDLAGELDLMHLEVDEDSCRN